MGGGSSQAGLERLLHTEGWKSAGAMEEMPKGFRTSKEVRRAELSKNEGSEGRDRAGGALALLPVTGEGGGGRTDLV